jgi:HEAT repeat protein
MARAVDRSNSTRLHRIWSRGRLLFILLSGAGLILFVFAGLGAATSREEGIVFGASTFLLKFDSDATQTNLFTRTHDPSDPSAGDFDSEHDFTLRLPSGVLNLHIEHDPIPVIHKRLPDTVPALIKLLDSRNPAEVFCASEALEEQGTAAIAAFPKLLAAAARTGLPLRGVETIAFANPKAAIPALVQHLSSTNQRVRRGCASLLGATGTNALSAVPALRAAFNASTSELHVYAQALLSITGDCAATIPKLRSHLRNSTNLYEKRATLELFSQAGLQSAPALPDVLQFANAPYPGGDLYLRPLAVFAASRVSPDPELVLPVILSALDAPMPERVLLRPAAIRALGNLGALGLHHLVAAYRSTNRQDQINSDRQTAVRTLARMGPAAADALDVFIADLASGDSGRVAAACEIMKSMGERAAPAFPALTNLLHVPKREIRIHAASALTSLGHYSDTIVRVLVDSLAMSAKSPWPSPGSHLALSTLTQILRTNSAAWTVMEQRAASHPQVVRFALPPDLARCYRLARAQTTLN